MISCSAFSAGAPCPALCYRNDSHPVEFKFLENLHGFGKLPFAAIDEQDVGSRYFTFTDPLVAALQRL